MNPGYEAQQRENVPAMRLIIRRALRQAKLDASVQEQAMERARWEGDRNGLVHYRNARDRNRLAIRWIRERMEKATR